MIAPGAGGTIPPKPLEIQKMFNAIAPTYDTLNHILSFGLDIRWRRRAISFLNTKHRGTFLDIAAGSGDFSIDSLRLDPQYIVSTDFAQQMLKVFQLKLRATPHRCPIHLVSCDALSLPFRDQSFDGIVVGFGIRNFADRLIALREMHRVLKRTGLTIILELSRPNAPLISQIYYIYSRLLLPLIGKIISRHNNAYRYLPESIATFPKEAEFSALMRDAGFTDVGVYPLTFGVATIYVGRKA